MGRRRAFVGFLTAVLLVTSCGPSLPEVVGQELPFARGAMEAAGFEYTVESEVTDRAEPGTVIRVDTDDDGDAVLIVAQRPSKTIEGTFTLLASTTGPDHNCQGSRGYSDISSNMRVTVRDGSGAILATASTGPGTRLSFSRCEFEFTVEDVPVVDFYEIEVGRRGSLSYGFAELEARDFRVAFSLG